ncbi:MAG: hypothetical protein HRT52_19645 [Colwellia sp.]|nr:hypothetical protein [Colwellia sp.]
MIKFLFLCLCIIPNIVLASSSEVYDTNTIQEVKSIYWLNQKQDSAIIYATWENFNSIKSFINTAALTGTTTKNPVNLESADILLLTSPNQNKLFKVYFTDDFITINGQSYSADSAIIAKFREINKSRIAKGDSISPKVLRRALKSNS